MEIQTEEGRDKRRPPARVLCPPAMDQHLKLFLNVCDCDVTHSAKVGREAEESFR
jgi:hypothetical protein